jgi:hypothetical protein
VGEGGKKSWQISQACTVIAISLTAILADARFE